MTYSLLFRLNNVYIDYVGNDSSCKMKDILYKIKNEKKSFCWVHFLCYTRIFSVFLEIKNNYIYIYAIT